MDPSRGRTSGVTSVTWVLAWVVAVATGFGILLRYKATPGEAGAPPALWPQQSRLRPPSGSQPALVLFAHPHCGCTQASLSELQRLAAGPAAGLPVQVVIVRPDGVGADWDDTELQRRAASIPRATVVRDEGGVEAARFRAFVSGFTLLYDGGGRLRFSGGLTSSRGHEGDSFGRRRLLAALAGEVADRADAPVFGCALGVKEGS